jgi:hypothetical protein
MAGNDAHRRRLLHNGCARIFLSWILIDACQVLFLRQYSLKRAVVRGSSGEKGTAMDDPEKGVEDELNGSIDQAPVLTSGADEGDEEATAMGCNPSGEKAKDLDYEQESERLP